MLEKFLKPTIQQDILELIKFSEICSTTEVNRELILLLITSDIRKILIILKELLLGKEEWTDMKIHLKKIHKKDNKIELFI
jgi:hypothetical protein